VRRASTKNDGRLVCFDGPIRWKIRAPVKEDIVAGMEGGGQKVSRRIGKCWDGELQH
jgi:hypothetical protein